MKNKLVIQFILFFSFCCVSLLHGGNTKRVKGLKGTSIIVGEELFLEDYHFQEMIVNSNYNNLYYQDYADIRVRLKDENNEFINYASNWTLTIKYQIKVKSENNVETTFTDILVIDYQSSEDYIDIASKKYSGYYSAKVEILNVYFYSSTLTSIPKSVRFDVELDIERHYVLNVNNIPDLSISNSGSYGFSGPNNDHLELKWTPVNGAEFYDLEWLFVDFPEVPSSLPLEQYPVANTPITVNDLNLDFKNATRIRLSDFHYNFTLNYPRGYILYRIRAVGKTRNGTLALGHWSSSATASDLNGSNTNKCIAYKGNSSPLNWQYTAVYAEQGKRKEIISYLDGSLRTRQSLSLLNTNGNVVVNQTMLDREGREVMSILPAVVSNNHLQYRYNLNKNTGGTNYTWQDFDQAPYILNPNEMSTSGLGAAKYYSNLNTTATIGRSLIPDAEGYPFSRTILSDDGLNRPVRTSGIGAEMKMGSEHDIETMYMSPAGSEELDKLFGTEAGITGYTKKLSIDQNEQITLEYYNQNEQLIASTIIADFFGDKNLKSLDSNVYPLMDIKSIKSDLLETSNVLDNITWESVSVVSPEMNNVTYTFDYELISSKYNASVCNSPLFNQAPLAPYDILIYIKDQDGQNVSLNVSGTTMSEISLSQETHVNRSFTAVFELGNTYYITKKLVLLPGLINANVINQLSQTSLLCSEWLVNNGNEPQLIFGCVMDCMFSQGYQPVYDMQGAVIHYVNVNDNSDIVTLDDPIHKSCLDIIGCNNDLDVFSEDHRSICEIKKDIMLTSMRKGGNYFENTAFSNTPNYDSEAWLTAHVDMATMNGFNIVFANDWTLFKTVYNAYVNNGNTLSGTPYASNANMVSFFSTWTDDSWEYYFFKKHPEYDVYNCQCNPEIVEFSTGTYQVHFERFDKYYADLYNVHSDAEALEVGLFNPFGPNQTIQIPDQYTLPQTYTPLSLSEVWDQFDLTGVLPSEYLVDSFLVYGLEYSFPVGLAPRAINESNFIQDLVARLSSVTTIGTTDVSVWDIIAKSFEMSGDPNFTSTLTSSQIANNPYLNALLGSNKPLDGSNPNITNRARIDYFRSQYYFFREMLWYDRVRTKANSVTPPPPQPYYFDASTSVFPPVFPDISIYNDVLVGTSPMTYVVDSFAECSDFALDWATSIVESFRWKNTPLGLYDDFNSYQAIIDQYPVTGALLTQANTYITNETQLINSLAQAFINKECNGYNGLPESFLTTPITSTGFDVQISSNPLSSTNFKVSKLSNLSISDLSVSFVYPFEDIMNNGNTGPSYPNYTPKELAKCSCNNFLSYLSNNGLSSGTDAQIASQLVNDDIIVDETKYSPYWKTYCNLNENVLDYLFTSKFPDEFFCLPYPYLSSYKEEYVLANNIYQTDYVEYTEEVNTLYGTLTGYILDEIVENALDNVKETFTMIQPPSAFHYTLYYYDQSGNLIKTVPPKGVEAIYSFQEIDSLRETQEDHIRPEHESYTNYQYNSLNQITEQTTPDGGLTKYWYDELGRLILSQNAQQLLENKYSYTLYDQLSRTIESGQVTAEQPLIEDRDLITKAIKLNGNFSVDYTFLTPYYIWLQMNEIEERTQIIYDKPIYANMLPPYFPNGQENLRLRISGTTYRQGPFDGILKDDHNTVEEVYDLIELQLAGYNVNIMPLVEEMDFESWKDYSFQNASHYTYDIHGNVSRLVQQSLDIFATNLTFKTIDYSYDLISGNVNQVIYQKHFADQYSHRYYYDADNRLTEVETSSDLDIWETQAKYYYYAHGPLARVEVGDKQVQANDYAYTLQGWLKSVNSASLNKSDDPGLDGVLLASNKHKAFAENVFGYNLHYFDGDYKSITTSENHLIKYNPSTSLGSLEPYRNLYNGNITSMVTSITGAGVQSTRYTYDQLNRIKTLDVYTPTLNNINNHIDIDQTNHTTKYQSSYAYDPDGNILELSRKNELGSLIDDFTYSYHTTQGIVHSNKLKKVTDSTPNNSASLGTNDFEDDGFTSSSIYQYDAIGNLKVDKIEEIADINWGSTGKIRSITRTPNSHKNDLEFEYDAQGNRISKLVKPRNGSGLKPESEWKKTIYIRDAQGMVMATYKSKYQNNTYDLQDFHIYGSERLGVQNIVDPTSINATSSRQSRQLGLKQYELKNHLGNVLATISDVKRPVGSGNNVTYTSERSSYSDYYPFGMQMPGRKMNGGDYKYGFNGMENDNEIKGDGNHLDFGARGYDPRLGRWQALDPLASKFANMSPYNFVLNSPLILSDPDGREPILETVGTVEDFIALLNISNNCVGLYQGQKASDYLASINDTKFSLSALRPMPTQSAYYNNLPKGRYIYTKKGGWIDVSHFMFYASEAYNNLLNGELHCIGGALLVGLGQEISDLNEAGHSSFSYEDLPSDRFGADFAVNYFDPESNLNLGEQIAKYMNNVLEATIPENAPNFSNLPATEEEAAKSYPTEINFTSEPMHTDEDGTSNKTSGNTEGSNSGSSGWHPKHTPGDYVPVTKRK